MLQFRSTLSRQGAALAHLDSTPPYDLVLWTARSVPFPFDNGGPGVFANCSLCGTEATLFFRQAQYAQVFLLKPAPFCTLFAGLGSINKSATFLLFSSYLILILSSSSCSLLSLSCYLNLSGRNCLLSSPVLSGYNGSLDTCFFRETAQLMSWPDGERYSCPQQFLVIFFLSLISTHHFSLTGGVLSHRSSLTHRFPQFPPRYLWSLITLAVCFFAFASTAYCYALISLGLAESKILPAAPADTCPRTPLMLFCTVQLRTLSAARFLVTLCLSTTSGQSPGEFPGF